MSVGISCTNYGRKGFLLMPNPFRNPQVWGPVPQKSKKNDNFGNIPETGVRLRTSTRIYDDLYPQGTLVVVLKDVIDPFKSNLLKKNSIVTVERIEYQSNNNTWIICSDQTGTQWGIRPKELEKVDMHTEKVGRFRILATDTLMENQNKPKE